MRLGAARGGSVSQFLAPALRPEDEEVERSLRPRRLDDFVGQERVKEQLRIALDAAKARGEALDHVLLAGPPGLGKTTLAQIVREELGVGLRTVAGPALEKKDIAAILTALEPRDVLFIDEIHRLNRAAEEILYPALEDFRLDIVFGQGAAARTLTLDLPPFTLVGATTRTGPADDAAARPLRDDVPARLLRARASSRRSSAARRGSSASRSPTTRPTRSRRARAARRGSRTGSCGACATSRRSRHAGAITTDVAREALELLEVDEQGLERIDRELLEAIAYKFGGGPGRPLDARRRARRGDRHDRGRLRAVPAPARLPPAHAARAGDHRARPRARRRGARRREPVLSAEHLDAGHGRPARRAREAHPAPDRDVQGRARARARSRSASSSLDGSLHRLESLSAEPGFGFVSFRPHDGDEPEELIVPLGAVREIRIGMPRPSRRSASSGLRRDPAPSRLELQRVPGRRRRELEQRAAAAAARRRRTRRSRRPTRPRASPSLTRWSR